MPKRIPIWKQTTTKIWPIVRTTLPLAAATIFFFGCVRYIHHFPAALKAFSWAFLLLPDITSYAIAMAGVGLFFMPEYLQRLETHPKIRLVIALVIFILGLGAVVADSAQKQADKNAAKDDRDKLSAQVTNLTNNQNLLINQISILNTQSMPQLFAGIQKIPKAEAAKPQPKPDLHLKLVFPEEFAVEVVNAEAASAAQQPKYQLLLVDLDNLAGNVLPIPANGDDFIRPGEFWGPNAAMALPNVKSLVKQNDRITGYATVLCPDCLKTRAYWIYYEQGEGGWYCEMPKAVFPTGLAFFTQMRENVEGYLDEIAPSSCRVPIGNR